MFNRNAQQCTAKAKSTGKRCNNPAVKGRTVCRLHGGHAGRPIIHGRYSVEHRRSLAEKVQKFLEDPSPGDLTSELALMRALLQDFLGRYEDPLPMPVSAIDHAFGMIDQVSKLVERISRILNATALTQVELHYLQVTLIDLLMRYIDDPNKRLAFVSELRKATGISRGNSDGSSISIASSRNRLAELHR